MKYFKQILKEKLTVCAEKIFPEAALINCGETSTGFYCDFDIPIAVNPESFTAIKSLMEQENDNSEYSFVLSYFSGVYKNNDASEKMLQRIFVTAFETEAEFAKHKKQVEEAALRDHKKIGAKQELFSASSEIGQGLILWHPKGAIIRHCLESFGQNAHMLNDYQWVYTPHIGRGKLWETSGHLDFYKDSMYNPILIDGEEYYLKPMNCPFHIAIYNSEKRSYRELPYRVAEYGTVYRYELSGALNGLTRVRGFTQDDAHIICTDEQTEAEVINALKFSLYILKCFGFEDFTAYISTKPGKKFIGEERDWEKATEVLKKAVVSQGLEYKIDEGGGAFYGPKIDLKLNDSLGREWQCGTVQFDFNLPARFNMTYIGKDGKPRVPVMVHRALFGSLERFTALLIEHYGGDFPFWFSPVQIGVLPVKEKHSDYCYKLLREFKTRGFRTVIGDSGENLRNKIKNFEQERIPYILVVGDKETENGTFSVRSRKKGDLGEMDTQSLIEYLKPEIDAGVPKYIL